MKYEKLGNSDLNVSKICLGCMSFGDPKSNMHQWTLDQEATDRIVKKALDLGINFFDSANTYSKGTSEEYVGKAIKSFAKRSDVILASKVFFNEGHLSKTAIEREIEGTLKRFGTDYLDLYIIHRFDHSTPIEETMSALDSLVKKGKVRALGASAMYGYEFHNMQICAEKNGLTPFVSMQNHYNLLYREDERELIPICKQMNVALTPYSPLAAGRLARSTWESDSMRSNTDKTAVSKYDSTKQSDTDIAQNVFKLAKEKNVSMSEIGLAWLYKKGVVSPIVGVTKEYQLVEASKATDLSLSDEEMLFLESAYVPHKVVGAIKKEDLR